MSLGQMTAYRVADERLILVGVNIRGKTPYDLLRFRVDAATGRWSPAEMMNTPVAIAG